jgi:toxin-antitoxin system PIN domain toxin
MTPDVNVLVSAFRTDHAHHGPARACLDDALQQAANGRASFMLMGMVVAGFMRVTTHPKIFKQPDPLQDACEFIDSLLSSPGVQFQASSGAWPTLRELCLTQQIKGDLLTDAWIAASVLQSGETLCTFDRDFTRLLPSDRLLLLKP